MQIDKSSWTYDFLSNGFVFADSNECSIPSNLCPYMRRVIAGILVTICAFTIVGVFALSGLVPIFYLLSFSLPSLDFIPVFLFGLAIDTILVWFLLSKFLHNKRIYITEIFPKPPSLITAWFEAMHNKICPSITFTGESND